MAMMLNPAPRQHQWPVCNAPKIWCARHDKTQPDTAVTVNLQPGYYFQQQPLQFSAADGGSASAPVTWQGAPGTPPTEVVISGGRRITDWRQDGDVWVAEVPGVADGEWYFRELYVANRRAQRARW